MSKRLVFPALALVAMSLGASFNGCACSGEAKIGNMEAKQPEPPPPPPPPTAPPPPAPVPPPPLKTVKNVSIEDNKVKIPGKLEFDVDKATLRTTPQSTDILNTLAQFMKENPNVTKLRVEGHTDNSGTADHNMKLSNDRAAAVAKWLGEHGVEAGRVQTVGYGDTKPIAPNDSAANKEQNRRTEFKVIELDGKAVPDAAGTAGTGAATGGTAGTTATTAATTGAATAPATAKTGATKDAVKDVKDAAKDTTKTAPAATTPAKDAAKDTTKTAPTATTPAAAAKH